MDLDKLKFWKKKDDFADLDKELGTLNSNPKDTLGLQPNHDPMAGSNTGLDMQPKDDDYSFGMTPPSQDDPFQRPQAPQQPLQQQQYHQPQQAVQQAPQYQQTANTQMDLVVAKLDTIKVSIESINHRLLAVERALHVRDYRDTQQPRRKRGVW
jgi:hypothetical protein